MHVAIIGTPVAALFLVWAFTLAEPNHPAVYLSYVFSAYMFVVVCVRITRSDPLHAIRRIACQSTHVARYLDNRDYRAIKGAQLAFAVDTFWALANLAFGVFFGAVWYVTLAAYYLLHALMRAVLMCHIHDVETSEALRKAYKSCRICGVLITFSTLIIAGIVTLVLHQEGSFAYYDMFIYVVALYAFWSLTSAIMNFLSYRGHSNPLLFTVMNVNLVTALVSMFSLEIAMLASFGGTMDMFEQAVMIAITGAAVALINVGIGVFLVLESTKRMQ